VAGTVRKQAAERQAETEAAQFDPESEASEIDVILASGTPIHFRACWNFAGRKRRDSRQAVESRDPSRTK